MDAASTFQPHQILCLEHEGTCLYGEVIQVAALRQLCWVRPLMLAIPIPQGVLPSATTFQITSELVTLYDLRQGADLLWPLTLFRAALDTEVISLLPQLEGSKTQLHNSSVAHQQLKDFAHKVWQAHPYAF